MTKPISQKTNFALSAMNGGIPLFGPEHQVDFILSGVVSAGGRDELYVVQRAPRD